VAGKAVKPLKELQCYNRAVSLSGRDPGAKRVFAATILLDFLTAAE
jgi:hypothetical protein